MKNTKIVEGVFLETVFIIVDVAVLIYGTLERSNREYNNINTTLKQSKTTFLTVMKVGEKLKNTLLDVAQNFDKMSDSEEAEVNDNVRKQFDNIIHGKPPKTEREKEIDKLAREELEEYRQKKKAFYDNPIHWDNNKRRRHGLPVLRGNVNKCRLKEYPGFFPSVRFFCMMEDLFDEILITTMEDNLNSFVEVKDIAAGDAKVF